MDHVLGEQMFKEELESQFDKNLAQDVTDAIIEAESLMDKGTIIWNKGLLVLYGLDQLGYQVIKKS